MENNGEVCDIVKWIGSNNWRYAKTMPTNPHWYTLRREWEEDENFTAFVRFIRKWGYVHRFKGRPYTNFNINGYKYWTMGALIDINGQPHTILINRAHVTYASEYNGIADQYDQMFLDKKYVNEDIELFTQMQAGGSILDVGCGSGMFLRYHAPERYIGIDRSVRMVDLLKIRFPRYAKEALCCTVDDFYTRQKFDSILALYGTASYFTPADVEKLTGMLSDRGRLILMYYKPGYVPVTYTELGISVDTITPAPSDGEPWHNYIIKTIRL